MLNTNLRKFSWTRKTAHNFKRCSAQQKLEVSIKTFKKFIIFQFAFRSQPFFILTTTTKKKKSMHKTNLKFRKKSNESRKICSLNLFIFMFRSTKVGKKSFLISLMQICRALIIIIFKAMTLLCNLNRGEVCRIKREWVMQLETT